jgi:4-amino-4-deoxy-L-arabinose transferase-like glycosyltransferase
VLAVPVLLLAAMAALLVTSSAHKKLAYDEFDNLAYGHRFLVQGPSAEMQGQRMPVLALNALPCLAEGCRQKALNADEGARLLVRLPTIAFTLALGILVWRFAGELFGPRAAVLALVLYAFQPTFLGHGKQVTSDVQTAFFTTLAVYLFRRALMGASRRWAAVAGLALAGALASKFTSVLLVPILVVMAVSRRDGVTTRTRVELTAIALLAGLVALNAVYAFDGTFRAAGTYEWRSEGFRRAMPSWLPLPVPHTFALGLDYSRLLQEDPSLGRGSNYVLGELNRDGRWYAFPLMLLLKTPLATFILLALAAARVPRRDLADLLAAPAIVVVFFSLFVDPQLGIRYILPALPFLVLLASAAAADGARRAWWTPWILAAWAVVSALSYHPHPIAYFNELIGSRVNAYRYLADSNLDWEDVDHFVEEYRRAHPETPLVVSPDEPQAGTLLVGANDLVGIHDPEKYRWLRESFRPVGHVAYSHLLFRVTPEELSRATAR